jgi:hypothetical protein
MIWHWRQRSVGKRSTRANMLDLRRRIVMKPTRRCVNWHKPECVVARESKSKRAG